MASTITIARERKAEKLFETKATLPAKEPFALSQSIRFLGGFRPMADEQETGRGALTKALMISGRTIAFTVREQSPGSNVLDCTLFSKESIRQGLRESVLQRISFFLSLDDDLDPFYRIVKRSDPEFMPVVKEMYGFHHVKFPSVLECAVWSILAQHSPLALSRKQKYAITERFGGSIELEGELLWAFPDHGRLAEAGFEEVAKVINNRRKTEYLVSLLDAYPGIDQEGLRKMDYEQAKQRLMEIKGIGDWSSSFILTRGMGRMEGLPSNLRKEIPRAHEVYGTGMSVDRVRRIYGEWAGYWLLYLWAHGMKPGDREDRHQTGH